jgi:hypothetical protein
VNLNNGTIQASSLNILRGELVDRRGNDKNPSSSQHASGHAKGDENFRFLLIFFFGSDAPITVPFATIFLHMDADQKF